MVRLFLVLHPFGGLLKEEGTKVSNSVFLVLYLFKTSYCGMEIQYFQLFFHLFFEVFKHKTVIIFIFRQISTKQDKIRQYMSFR